MTGTCGSPKLQVSPQKKFQQIIALLMHTLHFVTVSVPGNVHEMVACNLLNHQYEIKTMKSHIKYFGHFNWNLTKRGPRDLLISSVEIHTNWLAVRRKAYLWIQFMHKWNQSEWWKARLTKSVRMILSKLDLVLHSITVAYSVPASLEINEFYSKNRRRCHLPTA